MNSAGLAEELAIDPAQPAQLGVLRGGQALELTVPPANAALPLGEIEFLAGSHMTIRRPSPRSPSPSC